MGADEDLRLNVEIDPHGLCPGAEQNGGIATRRAEQKVAVDEAEEDVEAEDRSEDDGMREHADKAADPTSWAAAREQQRSEGSG